jgi:hypothetical protein
MRVSAYTILNLPFASLCATMTNEAIVPWLSQTGLYNYWKP